MTIRGVLVTLIVIASVLYGILMATVFVKQRSFIYLPPKEQRATTPGYQLVSYRTDDGLTLKAGYRAPAKGMPTVLFFHGNGADWQSGAFASQALTDAGYGVFAAEYRGYQGNSGTPDEQGLYRDGRAARDWLVRQGVDADSLVIIGNSIGSGVAVQLASEVRPAALILISPFASLTRAAKARMPWLPVGLLLRDRYDNERKVGGLDMPILVLHGTGDRAVPAEHAHILARANTRIELQLFDGMGHDLAYSPQAQAAGLEWLAKRQIGAATRSDQSQRHTPAGT